MAESDEPAETSAPPRAPRAKLREQLRPALSSVLVLTLLAGGAFPLLLFAIAWPLFPGQVRGTLVRRIGVVIGSELIGQEFTRPEYFQSRPSAAGSGYDGTASGGTSLGPNNPKLVNGRRTSPASGNWPKNTVNATAWRPTLRFPSMP
jgi:K+-transporting ATPase KdpC subunit